MAMTITIAATDRTTNYVEGSLRITDALNRRNTATLILQDPTGSLTFAIGAAITVTVDAVTEFSGTLHEITVESPASDESFLTFRLQCVDHNAIADRLLVTKKYTNTAVEDIVNDFINNALIGGKSLGDFGVTAGTITAGPILDEARWSYQPVSEALDELADFIGYSWYIDYSQALQFFDRKTFVAGWDISDSSKTYRDTRIRRRIRDYRNRQYLRGGFDISDTTRTETFVGDGERATFVLQFPVGREPTILLNGSSQTVGVRSADTDEVGGPQWFYAVEEKEIGQNSEGTVLASGDTLSVQYNPLFRIILRGDNIDEQSSRGEYEAIEEDERIKNLNHAYDRVQGLLAQFSTIPEEVEIETDQTPRIRAGQVQTVANTALGITSAEYLITEAKHQDIGGLRLRTRYRAVDTDRVRNYTDFFRDLISTGRKFSSDDNELLNQIVQNSQQMEFSHTLSSTETNSLTTWTSDPYTTALVGDAVIGKSPIGPVLNP